MMKSEKGVTLVSLIIYVIAIIITVTIITFVTSYFAKNIDVTPKKYTYSDEFTKLESYFSEEANEEDNKILKVSAKVNDSDVNQQYIAFSTGNQYTYIKENKAIYKNNIKIASGVEECEFLEIIKNGKQAIKMIIKIQDIERTMEYVLKN